MRSVARSLQPSLTPLTRLPALLACLIVLAFSSAGAVAQQQPPAPPPVTAEPEIAKIGQLAPRETGTMQVRLINTGDKPLRFERVAASCSCVKGKVETDPVAPGEAAILDVEMEAIINDGVLAKQLFIFAEGYARPFALTVQSDVVDPNPLEAQIFLEPESLDVGYIAPSGVIEREVLIHNKSDQSIQFARVSTNCTCVQGTIMDDITHAGESARLKVTVTARDFVGPINQTLTIWHHGARRPLQLPVTAEVTLPVKAEPFFINLAIPGQGEQAEDGDLLKGRITLNSVDDRPFRVLSAGGKPPVLGADDPNSSARKHVVHYDFTGVPEDELEPWWLIETDHPDAPLLDLRVIHPSLIRKMVANQGPWTIAPDRVIIPSLAPGKPAESTVRVIRLASDHVDKVSVDSKLLDVEIVSQENTPRGLELTLRFNAAPDAKGVIRTKLMIESGGVTQGAHLFARVAGAA